MSALVPLCHLIGINPAKLAKQESALLEAELFIRICEELKEVYRKQYKNYFCVMKFTLEKENAMLEKNFISLIIRDILSTQDYTLEGIARYIDTHEDVVNDLVSGRNTTPTATCLRKTVELHRSVRRELYEAIGKKIASEYLSVA